MKNNKYNRGFVGLIALLIVVLIMAYLMVTEIETYGVPPSSTNIATTTSSTGGSTSVYSTAIEKAQNARGLLEAKDRANLGQ